MRFKIQTTPAYELLVDVENSQHGHSVKLITFVPTARRPEEQVKFQAMFSTAELTALRDALNHALGSSQGVSGGAKPSRSSEL